MAFGSLDCATGKVMGIGALNFPVGKYNPGDELEPPLLLFDPELLLEDCLFHCCHTSLLPLLTQIYLALGVSPKLPILEQAPPSLGVAAFAWVIASGEVRRMKQARIESLRM